MLTYKEYKYLYETHLHTNQGSACGNFSGKEMAKAAKEYGYAGIFVTEHNWGGNTSAPRELPFEKWVDVFVEGYKGALEYGKKNDLDVFWGYEAGYQGTEFLIYGVTPEWLKLHPELWTATIEEQYNIIHQAGGLVIHAHPFREEWYIPEIRLFPEYVDGVEGINATHSNHLSTSHNDPVFNDRAIEYAKKYNFPMTAGSDVHSTSMFGGGVLLKNRIKSVKEFIDIIKSGDYMLTDGDKIFDSKGLEISE